MAKNLPESKLSDCKGAAKLVSTNVVYVYKTSLNGVKIVLEDFDIRITTNWWQYHGKHVDINKYRTMHELLDFPI